LFPFRITISVLGEPEHLGFIAHTKGRSIRGPHFPLNPDVGHMLVPFHIGMCLNDVGFNGLQNKIFPLLVREGKGCFTYRAVRKNLDVWGNLFHRFPIGGP
jgi:hypothetical protein